MPMAATLRSFFLIVIAALLAGCGANDDEALGVAIIATPEELTTDGLLLSSAGQHVRAATDAGLVARDPQGEVIPALAQSWLVTDDGLSYIFRLQENTWPDGRELTAEDVRRSLERSRRALRGTSLGLDLAAIAEIRAMTGRVLELRLSTPVPNMLMLLAQPELAIRSERGSLGAMTTVGASSAAERPPSLTLRLRPPEAGGLPDDENWRDNARDIAIHALDGEEAIRRFYDGEVDLVLGGTIGYMPMVSTGPLTRGTARIDPAIGLFGLLARNEDGLLASETLREALSMAIDREALLAPFGIGGWLGTTRLVAPGLPSDTGLVGERWAGESIEDRRARAASQLSGLLSGVRGPDGNPVLTIALGNAPGHEMLLQELARQWALVGVTLERADEGEAADLVLLDRVARYADPRWFLNQFHCRLRRGLCDAEVDAKVADALAQGNAEQRSMMLAEAEAALTDTNFYIPLGMPLRWSLARGSVEPFESNPWAFHPLPPMALIPN